MSSTVSCSRAAHSVGLVHAQLGQDRGHGERVGDVRVAALAQLTLVHPLRSPIGPLDQRQVGLGMVGPDDPEQRVQRRGLRPGRAEPGDPLPHPNPRRLDAGCGAGRILDVRLGLRRDDQGPAGRRRARLSGAAGFSSCSFARTAAPESVTTLVFPYLDRLPILDTNPRHTPATRAARSTGCWPVGMPARWDQALRRLRSPGGPRPPGHRARAWRRSDRRSAAASCCAPPRSPDRRPRRSGTCRPRPW